MRNILILLSTVSVAACSGGGPTTIGGNAAPAAAPGTTTTTTASTHTFVAPTQTKTYQAQGAAQSYDYTYLERVDYKKTPITTAQNIPVLDALGNPTYGAIDPLTRTLVAAAQFDQVYKAEARTVRNPGITVSYDPKNAQFALTISQNGLSDNITFQDPAHRTDFAGARTPQNGVPSLNPTNDRTKGIQYLEADSGSSATTYDVSTFFYELPGSNTKYVTYAGFVRNHTEDPTSTIVTNGVSTQTVDLRSVTKRERVAFVFGEQTPNASVPKTGTATFNGNMVASMVNNPSFDTNPYQGTYFQWISGTAKVDVNFGTGVVGTQLDGTTLAPLYDNRPLLSPTTIPAGVTYDGVAIPAGAIFSAIGAATIDLVNAGGFIGSFSRASLAFGGVTTDLAIVGSSLDGAFYGPAAQEVGASFRIVGGIPDQRVDIVGSFAGK